jgi:pimeloyl-ACP methyl ester carboxylesterase
MRAMGTAEPSRTIAPLEQAAQRFDVPVRGGTVAWRRLGKGAPLVLLHGGHGNWLHWVRNVESLAADFELWIPDMPGYGDSSALAEPTLHALVAATRDSIDSLIGSETPIGLAGFSFGGLVAAHLALRRGHVTRMALLGPAGHGDRRRPRGELRSWREALARQDQEALHEVMRHNLMMRMLAGDAADAVAVEIHTRACLATRFHSKTISRSGGLIECLRQFAGPLLLMWGEHDVTATPSQLAPAIAAQCVEGRAEVIADAGHWVQYQAAADINARLRAWFGPAAGGDPEQGPAA